MPFNAERNDDGKVLGGTWCKIMGGQFLIARAGNPNYLAAQERNGKRKAENAEERQEALYKSIAEGILLGWKDVTDNDGKDIPYSVEAAVKVLDDNPDLVTAVLSEANDFQNFRRKDIADQTKKPQKGSATS